jgi:hypothetical protein
MEKREPCVLLVGMEINTAIMENTMEGLKKLKTELHIIQQSHCRVYIQRKQNQYIKELSLLPCSLQHSWING